MQYIHVWAYSHLNIGRTRRIDVRRTRRIDVELYENLYAKLSVQIRTTLAENLTKFPLLFKRIIAQNESDFLSNFRAIFR